MIPIIEEESMSESFSSSAEMSSESEMYQKELRDKIIPMANLRRGSTYVSSSVKPVLRRSSTLQV